MLKRVLVWAVKKIYPRFGLDPSDIILAAFPKAGSTWVRFIIANILSLTEMDGKTIDYRMLNEDLAAVYDTHTYPVSRHSTLPLFVMTHMRYDERRFGKNRSLYVYRNPADTMVSFFEYMKARLDVQYSRDFKSFIRDKRYGLETWCRHVSGWKGRANAIVTYEGLKTDGLREMKRAFNALNIPGVPDEILEKALVRSDFHVVRRMEEVSGLDAKARSHLRAQFRFARSGVVGQWKEYLDKEDLDFFESTLRNHGFDGVDLLEVRG